MKYRYIICSTEYGRRIDDAHAHMKRGEVQVQCVVCKRWFWPNEKHSHEGAGR